MMKNEGGSSSNSAEGKAKPADGTLLISVKDSVRLISALYFVHASARNDSGRRKTESGKGCFVQIRKYHSYDCERATVRASAAYGSLQLPSMDRRGNVSDRAVSCVYHHLGVLPWRYSQITRRYEGVTL